MDSAYTATLIAWCRSKASQGKLDNADVVETGYNPKCGDRLTVYIKKRENNSLHVVFEPEACMLCVASAESVIRICNDSQEVPATLANHLAEVVSHEFSLGVYPETEKVLRDLLSSYPVRKTCLTLPWETVINALRKTG